MMNEAVYLKKRFSKTPIIVSRKIANKYILVPIQQNATDVESIYNLNEVAARIWELIDGQRPLVEIRDLIVQEFKVEPETAGIDLIEVIKQLEEVNAVKES